MATAYKYVERKAEDNINWAEVGKNVTNMLQEENRVREEKKAAIDAATREYQKVLNNVPQGENTELNSFALNAAADLQQQMLMQEQLLKSGQMDPRQYTIMRQNLVDGTDQAFGLMESYNQEYSKKMAELDQLSQIDLDIMANVESFANFTDHKLVINPETGIMSVAKMIDDPNNPGQRIPDSNPNNLASVQSLQNRIKQRVDKYDVVGAAKSWTNTLGTDVRAAVQSFGTTYSAGTIKTITDITQREGGLNNMSPEARAALAKKLGVKPEDMEALSSFQEAQSKWADSELDGNTMSGASALIDFMKFTEDGQQYTTTFDPAEAEGKENVILLKNVQGRVTAELTETQRNNAKRALETQSNLQLDYKEDVDVKRMKFEARPKSKDERDRGDREDKQDNVFSNVAKLYYGDDSEVEEAISFLRSANPDITDIDRSGESVIIRYEDGSQETLDFTDADGGTLGQKQWVEGNANFFLGEDDKIMDINKVSDRSKVDLTRDFNVASEGRGGETTETQEPVRDAYMRIIKEDAPAPSQLLFKDDDSKSKQMVSQYISTLPGLSNYTVDTEGYMGTDAISVKDADGNTALEINLDESTYDSPQEWTQAMEDFMQSMYELSYRVTSDGGSKEGMTAVGTFIQGKRKKSRSSGRNLRGDGSNKTNSSNKDRSQYNKDEG